MKDSGDLDLLLSHQLAMRFEAIYTPLCPLHSSSLNWEPSALGIPRVCLIRGGCCGRVEKEPCENVGVVVNDLLIGCELSLMCHLNSRHPLLLQPDQGCGFIIRTFITIKLCSKGLRGTALICLFVLYLFLLTTLIFYAVIFFRRMHFQWGL